MRPDEAQGYLVLNKVDNPDVSSWVVTLKERTYSAQGTPTDVQREKVTLKDNINFWCVPNTYLNSQSVFFAEVVG